MNLSGKESNYIRNESMTESHHKPRKLAATKTVEVGTSGGLGTSGGALTYKNMAGEISKQ